MVTFDDFFSSDLNEIWYVGRGRWVMHDGVPYGRIQGQGQDHEPFKIWIPSIFKTYLLRHLQWELASDHHFLNYSTISKFHQAGFLILVLVFVSRDSELDQNLSGDLRKFFLPISMKFYT